MNKLDNYRQIIEDCFPDDVTPSELIPYIKTHILSGNMDRFLWPEDLSSIVLCIYECYDIVGWTVDELPRAEKLLSSSLLLATTSSLSSASMKYGVLSSQMAADVKAQLDKDGFLETMAYASQNSFALSSHSHQKLYTEDLSVEYNPYIEELSAAEDPERPVIELGRLSAVSWERPGLSSLAVYPIWCPEVKVPSIALHEPAIGQLVLLPVKDLKALHAPESKLKKYGESGSMVNIDIYADDFNGWVFPNGTTFKCDPGEFAAAAAAFGNGHNDQFTVPNLDTFFYGITPRSQPNRQPLDVHPQQCIVGPHFHGVKASNVHGSLKIVDFDVGGTQVVSTSPGPTPIAPDMAIAYFSTSEDVSTVSFDSRTTTVAFNTEDAVKIDMQTAPSNYDTRKFQPVHQIIPVMMYIGKR